MLYAWDIESNRHSLISKPIYLTAESPNCLFEINHCAWRASNNWKISEVHPPTPRRQDWQASNGKFISVDVTRLET